MVAEMARVVDHGQARNVVGDAQDGEAGIAMKTETAVLVWNVQHMRYQRVQCAAMTDNRHHLVGWFSTTRW